MNWRFRAARLHHLAEGVGALGKLLALRRMPPCQEIVEEKIAGKDIVLQLLQMLVAPFAHEISIAFAVTSSTRVICRRHRNAQPIMRTGMVNGL
jgi:hypothetical protein